MQIDSCADPHPAARRVFGVSWKGGCFYVKDPPHSHAFITPLITVLCAIAHAQSETASRVLHFCTRDSCGIQSGKLVRASGGLRVRKGCVFGVNVL